jgi:hypothetical protein
MSRSLTLLAALLLLTAILLILRNYETNDDKDINLKPTPISNSSASAQKNDSNFHQWHEFTSETSNFKVLLPSLPQHVSDTVLDSKTKELRKFDTFALAEDNGSSFIINAITFDPNHEVKADEESFKGAVDDMITRNKDNKINSLKMGSFRGMPALDFSLNNEAMTNEAMTIEGKVFAHGNKMYILSMIHSKGTFNKKEFDFFINSFDFIDSERNTKQ